MVGQSVKLFFLFLLTISSIGQINAQNLSSSSDNCNCVCERETTTSSTIGTMPPQSTQSMLANNHCLQGWTAFGEFCYKAFLTGNLTFWQAEATCAALNSTIVSIHNEAENTFVKAIFASAPATAIWIGLRRTFTKAFYWTDGSYFDYGYNNLTAPAGTFPWAPMQPDGIPARGDATLMWLKSNDTNLRPAGSWDDTTPIVALDGTVCKRPMKSQQLPKLTGYLYAHDPILGRLGGGTGDYIVYGTHDGMRAIRSSSNNTFVGDWYANGSAIAGQVDWIEPYTKPGCAHEGCPDPKRAIWGPDLSYQNGKYYLYYCVASFGSQNSAIGLATSSTGEPGSFIDQGKVLESNDFYNAMDQSLFVDDVSGRWFLTFGSFFGGIFQIELDPSTGFRKADDPPARWLAWRPFMEYAPGYRFLSPMEAPAVFKKNSYYYLICSYDRCCGEPITYNIRYGRGNSPEGPFLDPAGTPMLNGGGKVLLGDSSNRRGPGNQIVYIGTEHGDLIIHHYYDANEGLAPKFDIKRLGWTDDGWPYILP